MLELPTRSATVSKPPDPKVIVGNTSSAEVSDFQIFLGEEELTELFGNRKEFASLTGFSSNETEEMEAENNSNITRMR